ncbi:DNA polymerase III subunit epsilon [Pseudomonas luteola]
MTNVWALDTETTGFDPEKMGDRIVEIGAVELDAHRKPTGAIIHEYVDPLREVPEGARKVHGKTREDLIELGNGQTFKNVIPALIEKLKGKTVIIHNAAFDIRFLDFEFEMHGFPKFSSMCEVFCTFKFASAKFPGQRNSLDALCKRFGIENNDRELHGALLDSQLLAQVYLSLTREQKKLDFTAATNKQNIGKLVEPITSTFEIPVYASEVIDEEAHERIIERINKESGGKSLWR